MFVELKLYTWLLLPSLLVAIAVRVDAKIVGPYFAMSSFFTGEDGLEPGWWSADEKLTSAVLRRFSYPLLAGFILTWLNPELSSHARALVGFLGGFLVLWPAIYHGLPDFLSKRDWEVNVLYFAYCIAYPIASYLGGEILELVSGRRSAEGVSWTLQVMAEATVSGIALLFIGALVVAISNRLSVKLVDRADSQFEDMDPYGEEEQEAGDGVGLAIEGRKPLSSPEKLYVATAGLLGIAAVSQILKNYRVIRNQYR